MAADALLDLVRREAHRLGGSGAGRLDAVLASIGDAPLVLLGEATHGSEEFYRLRAELSERLIVERGFDAVAVEADWPDALRASRYVRGCDEDPQADAALGGFQRFPRWMWRNTAVRDWLERLRVLNTARPAGDQRVGFYGLDLYSLHASIAAVLGYLDRSDPAAARLARDRYRCFDGHLDDPQGYGAAVHFGLAPDCEREVVAQLKGLFGALGDAPNDDEERFYAQQNARVVRNAERYYRSMFDARTDSWNLRDTHMAETLFRLRVHLSQRLGRPARIVVWAHNSHVGDARATEPGWRGQLTLGQLVRERARGEAVLVGFTTHDGWVAAASDWDDPVEHKPVQPSLPGSLEDLLHDTGLGSFHLDLRGPLAEPLAERRLERAIGVIYRPGTERASHYFHVEPSRQFDVVVHVDRTHAVTPLDASRLWQQHGEPQLAPSGL